LDLEVSGGLGPAKLIAWTKQWLTTVQNLTGRKAMIYSYPYFWSHNMRGTTTFRDHRLWGASYGSRPTTFGGAWSTWTFWQFSSTSKVPGIRAQSDMNRFHGTLAQLRRLANMGSTTSPGPAPAPAPTTSTTTKAATHLGIRTPATAGAWQSFDITGRLTRDGHGVAGKPIVVRGRLVGSDHWIDLPHVTTDSTGRWTLTVRAPDDAQIRASFAGTSRLAASRSRIATTTVENSYYQH